jgi:hypothetical protein
MGTIVERLVSTIRPMQGPSRGSFDHHQGNGRQTVVSLKNEERLRNENRRE